MRNAAAELAPLITERGAALVVDTEAAPVFADDRAAQRRSRDCSRRYSRLPPPGERLRARIVMKTRGARLSITRPRALAAVDGDALLTLDGDVEEKEGHCSAPALRCAWRATWPPIGAGGCRWRRTD